MLNISGYIEGYDMDIDDTQNDIAVLSCGRYKLIHLEHLTTSRPSGRKDYQMLYVAEGSADFWIEAQLYTVHAGSFVLYYPSEKQYYTYELEHTPDIYWIHFSGIRITELLKDNKLFGEHIFRANASADYTQIFEDIILELQLRRERFNSLVQLYFEELLLLVSRGILSDHMIQSNNRLVYDAIEYFHRDYRNKINIQDYADSINISCCWFIRSFRNQTGITPTQYITEIRINKAKELLKSGNSNISETSDLVGYDNPLYFSRIFRKHVGVSPREYLREFNSEYRKRLY